MGRRAVLTPQRAVSPWVRAVPITSAFVVGAASFTLSFFAQSAVAANLGAVPAHLSWLVPIIIDGGVLAGSASLWASSTRGSRHDPVAYLTVVTLLGLSVVVNVHHAAAGGGLLGAVIAGAPPVVLLLCLELVAAQARRHAVAVAAEQHEEVSTPVRAPATAGVKVTSPTVAAPAASRLPAPAAAAVTGAPVGSGVPAASVPSSTPLPAATPSSVVGSASVTATPLPAAAVASAVGSGSVTATPAPASPVLVERPASPLRVAAPTPTPVVRPAAAAWTPTLTPARPVVVPQDDSGDGRALTQADAIRARFARHVSEGGDPADRSLTRMIADELGAPVASVRKVLTAQRRALDEAAA